MKTRRKQIRSLGELVDVIILGKPARLEMFENVTIQSIDMIASEINSDKKPSNIIFIKT